MIRVIYSWKLDPKDIDEFKKTWRNTTKEIHKSTKGALGSFCIHSIQDNTLIKTIALWENEENWRTFMINAKNRDMSKMHAIATQLNVEAFNQIGDETII